MLCSFNWILEVFKFYWSIILQEDEVFKVELVDAGELLELVLESHPEAVSTRVRVQSLQTCDSSVGVGVFGVMDS